MFLPHNGVVKSVRALRLFISPSNCPILCKRAVTLRQHKEDVWNTHEQKIVQLLGNSLSVPAITSWLLCCASPLAWEWWYLRHKGCDREVTLSIFVGTESIKGLQLSSGIRAVQVSDIWIWAGPTQKGNVKELINIAVRLQRAGDMSKLWCVKGNLLISTFCPELASVFISNSTFILKHCKHCVQYDHTTSVLHAFLHFHGARHPQTGMRTENRQ